MATVLVRELLKWLPKQDVSDAWDQLSAAVEGNEAADAAVVWDLDRRIAALVSGSTEIAAAVLHGRPVHVVPVGVELRAARDTYETAVRLWKSRVKSKTRGRGSRSPLKNPIHEARRG